MIRRKRAVIFTILWIAVMVIIFRFSNDDAEASSAKSGTVVAIVETIEEALDLTPTEEIRAMTETIVRKCAHVFLYTCLGVTGTLAVSEYVGPALMNIQRRRKKSVEGSRPPENGAKDACMFPAAQVETKAEKTGALPANPARVGSGKIRAVTAAVTCILCFLYACTDEWHQTFRSGRSGSFRDVMIDSIGMVLGTGIVTMILVLMDHFRSKKQRES